MKDIVIIGAGGLGREVAWLIEDINKIEKIWNIVGFVDDNINVNEIINSYSILGNIEWLKDKSFYVACAINTPNIRKKIHDFLKQTKNKYATLVHPSVIMSDKVSLGEGVIILMASVITVNVTIGNHVIINYNSTVGHDAVIKDYVSIMPGCNISGNVILEESVSIGTGAQVIQGLQIGSNTVIGAGAVVVNNVPDCVVAVGVPAKPIKSINL